MCLHAISNTVLHSKPILTENYCDITLQFATVSCMYNQSYCIALSYYIDDNIFCSFHALRIFLLCSIIVWHYHIVLYGMNFCV